MACGSLIFAGCRTSERRLPSRRMSLGGLETAAPCYYFFNWRRFNALLAPDWLIRLSDDRNDFVLGVQQRP